MTFIEYKRKTFIVSFGISEAKTNIAFAWLASRDLQVQSGDSAWLVWLPLSDLGVKLEAHCGNQHEFPRLALQGRDPFF